MAVVRSATESERRTARRWTLGLSAAVVCGLGVAGCLQKDAAVPISVQLPDQDPQFGDHDPFVGVNALRLTVRAGTPGAPGMETLAERIFSPDVTSLGVANVTGGRDRFVVLEGCAETPEELEGGERCTVLSRGSTPPGDYLARGQQEPVGKTYSRVWLFFARVGQFAPLSRQLQEARAFPAAVDLENGKYVFAGGFDENGAPLDTIEVFDIDGFVFTVSGQLRANGQMQPRAFPAAVRLPGGGAVFAGGYESLETGTSASNFAMFVDRAGVPVDEVQTLSVGRGFAKGAVVREQGVERVVIAGGTEDLARMPAGGALDVTDVDVAGSISDLWDAGTLRYYVPLNVRRTMHTATALPVSGRVLFAGGFSIGPAPGSLKHVLSSGEVLEYGSDTGFRVVESSMSARRWAHTATLLEDGSVILAGGSETMSLTSGMGAAVSSMDRFVPGGATGIDRFVDPEEEPLASMSVPRAHHAAVRMNSGSVLLSGGAPVAGAMLPESGIVPYDSTEVFSVGLGQFVAGPSMLSRRIGHVAFALPDGNVLVAGGFDENGEPIRFAEIYTPPWPEDDS